MSTMRLCIGDKVVHRELIKNAAYLDLNTKKPEDFVCTIINTPTAEIRCSTGSNLYTIVQDNAEGKVYYVHHYDIIKLSDFVDDVKDIAERAIKNANILKSLLKS